MSRDDRYDDDRYEHEHDDDHYENELDDDRYEYSSSGASSSSDDRYDDDHYENDHDHADHHWDSDHGYESLSAAALQSGDYLTVAAPGWSSRLRVDYHAGGLDDVDDHLEAYQVDRSFSERSGSLLSGGDGSDVLSGRAGWDVLDGGGGDDLIHGGNGRDVITGGAGADELHGDFGWNTYKDQRDDSADLLAIKSDQHLMNWWYGTSGNNPNGEKADVIEGLDAADRIIILGVETDQLSFAAASAHGLAGIGIYADGALEAVYIGGDLGVDQLRQMTSGDASQAAMANQIWSYGNF